MSSYLQLKKRAFMSIVNGVKGFVRTVSGVPPISLEDCVDSDSLIDWKLYGNSVQEGTPTPEAPVEVVSVGEYDSETGKYKIPVTARGESSSITTYIYLDEPLRKVGDYADYVDFGKGEVIRNTAEITFDGSEAWYKTDKFMYLSVRNMQSSAKGFSTHIVFSTLTGATADIYFYATAKVLRMYQSSENPHFSDIEAFKAFLTEQAEAGTPVKVTYILAEPTRTPISIPKLPTIKGTTIYEIGTSLNASNMEATYYSSIKGE